MLLSPLIGNALDNLASLIFTRQCHFKTRTEWFEFFGQLYCVADKDNLPWYIAIANADVLQQANMQWVFEERMEVQKDINSRFGYSPNMLEDFRWLGVQWLWLQCDVESLQAVGNCPTK